MMYKFFTLIVAALAFSPLSVHADDSSIGLIQHGNEKLESLSANGRITLNGTQVIGPLDVSGSLSAHDAHIGAVNVNGHAWFYNSTVDGKCEVGGLISAEKSTFKDTILVTSRKINFDDCNVNSILVRKIWWPFSSQVVELTNSVCKGDITFESGKGRVILLDGSQVQGKVIGGEIKK